MNTPTAILRDFYAKLAAGDAPGALGLMAADIEWITMWHYKVDGRGSERVAGGVLKPLLAECTRFALNPDGFIADGETVVSLGRFAGVHRATGKPADVGYANVWTVRNGKVAHFRQYIDTLAVAEARKP